MPILGTLGRGRRALFQEPEAATTLVKNFAAVTAAAAGADDGSLFYSEDDGFTYVSIDGDPVPVAGTSLLLTSFTNPAAPGVSVPANAFSPLGLTGGLAPTLALTQRRPPGSPDLGYTSGLGVFGVVPGRLVKFAFITSYSVSAPSLVSFFLRGRASPVDPWIEIGQVCGHDRTVSGQRYCGQGSIFAETSTFIEFQIGLVHDGGPGGTAKIITVVAAMVWLEIIGLAS